MAEASLPVCPVLIPYNQGRTARSKSDKESQGRSALSNFESVDDDQTMPTDPPIAPLHGLRILVAFDGSSKDGPALKWALSAAEAFGGTVDVIHALGLRDSSRHSTETGETVRAHAEQECRQALQTVIDTAAPDADVASIQLRIEPGHPVLLLLREIERTQPDLVVLGRSPAHSGTATLGSVSREIASKSPVPVVVVPFDSFAP